MISEKRLAKKMMKTDCLADIGITFAETDCGDYALLLLWKAGIITWLHTVL